MQIELKVNKVYSINQSKKNHTSLTGIRELASLPMHSIPLSVQNWFHFTWRWHFTKVTTNGKSCMKIIFVDPLPVAQLSCLIENASHVQDVY
jgi:hypothetical protein